MANKQVNPYGSFFETQSRPGGEKPIAILRGQSLVDFLAIVAMDDSLSSFQRAFFVTLACTGLSVSDGLKLSKTSYEWVETPSGRGLFVKGPGGLRIGRIHPVVQDFVWEVISGKVGMKPFNWTRQHSLTIVKTKFGVPGLCNHSFSVSKDQLALYY